MIDETAHNIGDLETANQGAAILGKRAMIEKSKTPWAGAISGALSEAEGSDSRSDLDEPISCSLRFASARHFQNIKV